MKRRHPSLFVLTVAILAAVCRISAASDAPPKLERISEEAFRAVANFYAYDAEIPLDARIVERVEKGGTIRDKIVFRGARNSLVPGYLEWTPAEKPAPCVLLLHGWSGSREHFWRDGGYISGGEVRNALLEAGCAVLALDAQCHGDRIAENGYAPVNVFQSDEKGNTGRGYHSLPEIYTQTVIDYRRAIDYLATRPEIDAERIGAVGYSMGGTQTLLLAAVEPRVRVAVAAAVPAELNRSSPVAPQDYTHGIRTQPLLLLMGRQDPMCTPEHAQAMFEMIPSPTKVLEFYDADHKLPPEYAVKAAGWIERHLIEAGVEAVK